MASSFAEDGRRGWHACVIVCASGWADGLEGFEGGSAVGKWRAACKSLWLRRLYSLGSKACCRQAGLPGGRRLPPHTQTPPSFAPALTHSTPHHLTCVAEPDIAVRQCCLQKQHDDAREVDVGDHLFVNCGWGGGCLVMIGFTKLSSRCRRPPVVGH